MRSQKLYRIKLMENRGCVAAGCVPVQDDSDAFSISLHEKWAIFHTVSGRLFPDLKLAIEPILRFGVRTHR
jgi:hypothetical protein